MITNKLLHDTSYVELEGLSTDSKPLEGISTNSKFYELDTGDVYYFTGDTWAKVGGDGGNAK